MDPVGVSAHNDEAALRCHQQYFGRRVGALYAQTGAEATRRVALVYGALDPVATDTS